MRLFGFEISRAKDASPASDRGRGWSRILESFGGAWQQNVEVDQNLVLSYHALFACLTLIASDVSKLRVKFTKDNGEGVWVEQRNSAYDPVLRRPNKLQNRIQFWESWILSKLMKGNTYVLKGRDARKLVNSRRDLHQAAW